MIDPMLLRLSGCLVLAGLLSALLLVVTQPQPREAGRRDVVAAAEITHRVAETLLARP